MVMHRLAKTSYPYGCVGSIPTPSASEFYWARGVRLYLTYAGRSLTIGELAERYCTSFES